MKFDMIRPCVHCPFRNDAPGYLRPTRAAEIADALLHQDQTFPCHETTVSGGDAGERYETSTSQHCAGALIFLELQGRPNQLMRIAERLGIYDRRKLDMGAPVCTSRRALVQQHTRLKKGA